jgi:hypothetical protein
MPAIARALAAAALTTAALTLATGCGEQGAGASPTGAGEPTELTRQERLHLIWRGNVLSTDREAVCAQTGDQRTQSFHSFVDPWLVGLPPASMPTDDDIVAFLDESCSTEGQESTS